MTTDIIEPFEQNENNNVHFLPEGKIEVDNKCLTLDNTTETQLEPIDCVDSPVQEWFSIGEKFYHNKTQKCFDKKYIDDHYVYKLNDCKQSTDFMDPNYPDTKYPSWNKKFGKNIVLVSVDNPWFINDAITSPKKNNKSIDVKNISIPHIVEAFDDKTKSTKIHFIICCLCFLIILQIIFMMT